MHMCMFVCSPARLYILYAGLGVTSKGGGEGEAAGVLKTCSDLI